MNKHSEPLFQKRNFSPLGMTNFATIFITPPKTFQFDLGVVGKEILTLSALYRSCKFLPLSDWTNIIVGMKVFYCCSNVQEICLSLNHSFLDNPQLFRCDLNFALIEKIESHRKRRCSLCPSTGLSIEIKLVLMRIPNVLKSHVCYWISIRQQIA